MWHYKQLQGDLWHSVEGAQFQSTPCTVCWLQLVNSGYHHSLLSCSILEHNQFVFLPCMDDWYPNVLVVLLHSMGYLNCASVDEAMWQYTWSERLHSKGIFTILFSEIWLQLENANVSACTKCIFSRHLHNLCLPSYFWQCLSL